MPKYSVIIPCYNAAKTIITSLISLQKQKFQDFEVIIIDDCSTDESVDVVNNFIINSNLSIHLILNEQNSGPGISRNKGIQAANGEYVCFLDSDDYFDTNYFDKLQCHLLKYNSDVVFFGNYHIIGNHIYKRDACKYVNIDDYMALSSGSLCKFCSLRSLWDGIDIPSIKNAEDIAVIPIVLSRAKNISTLDECIYYYIHSNTSLSSQYKPEVSHNFVKSFNYTEATVDIVRFFDAMEFHGIKTVLYGATLNALKANMSQREIYMLWEPFIKKYPNWFRNRYLQQYSKSKRLFLKLVQFRMFIFLRMYVFLHTSYLKYFS